MGVALLRADVLANPHHLWCVHEGALHTGGVATVEVEHVATSNQLVGSRSVEYDSGVHHRSHTEGDTRREVGLDGTGDNLRRRSLCGDNHVDAHGTGQLGDSADRQLYLLSGGHNQVTELVDYHHVVRHVVVSLQRIELARLERLVVFLYGTHTCHLQQVVPCVHQLTERVEGLDHLLRVRDNRFLLFLQFGEEVVLYRVVDTELHLLRVHHHYLQFRRVFLVEE